MLIISLSPMSVQYQEWFFVILDSEMLDLDFTLVAMSVFKFSYQLWCSS